MTTLGPYNWITKLLALGLIIQGSKGQGKSYLLFWLFCLCCWLNVPMFLIDRKGDLYKMCRDWAIANGFAGRLRLLDWSDNAHIPGYNPFHKGRPTDAQARQTRRGAMAGMQNFKYWQFPQMFTYLYLALYVVIEQALDITQASQVIAPRSALRLELLPKIKDPYVRQRLEAFDALPERQQADLSLPATARLEALCSHPKFRASLAALHSYDMQQEIRNKSITLVNAVESDEEMNMWLQMFFTDLNAECKELHQEGVLNQDHPVLVIADEFQEMAVQSWARDLDLGRGIGLHTIFAHHHSFQLQYQDESGYLNHSAKVNVMNRIVFGGINDPEELKLLVMMTFLDRLDPNRVLDIETPHILPKESTRVQKSVQVSQQEGETLQYPRSTTKSKGGSRDISETNAATNARADSVVRNWNDGEAEDEAESETKGLRQLAGGFFGATGLMELPVSYASLGGRTGHVHSEGGADVTTYIDSFSRALGTRIGTTWQESESAGVTPGTSKTKGVTIGATVVPFYEQQVVWLRTQPMSLEWQVVLYMRLLRDIPPGYFWIKCPGQPAVLVQCPYIEPVRIPKRQLEAGLARTWTYPWLFRLEEPQEPVIINLNGHMNGQNGHQPRKRWTNHDAD